MTTRREQIQAANRERIFTVAREIVASEGAPAVTIRRVATEIGYAAPIVYQHFADKADLLDAVMVDGYARLAVTMRDARDGDLTDGPRAIVRAYLDFAEANQRVFLLMHGVGGVDVSADRRLTIAQNVIALTVETLTAWPKARVQEIDVQARAEVLWAVSTGLALTGFALPDGFARAKSLAKLALEPVLASWASNGGGR